MLSASPVFALSLDAEFWKVFESGAAARVEPVNNRLPVQRRSISSRNAVSASGRQARRADTSRRPMKLTCVGIVARSAMLHRKVFTAMTYKVKLNSIVIGQFAKQIKLRTRQQNPKLDRDFVLK